ncbi:MAG TPA: ABC transporter permease [Anaerolineaceae bacterium]|nr:ABC transporter permease [Anaerolineaceae bacterium]
MIQRILAITQKEFIQTWRERSTLVILLTLPLLQLILFGYAIHMNVQHIPTVIADQSLDYASRAYLNDMVNSGYFDQVGSVSGEDGVVQEINAGRANAGIIIPPNFSELVQRGDAEVAILVDGSELFTSLSAYNAASIIGQNHAVETIMEQAERAGQSSNPAIASPLTAHIQILYNPDFKDLWFIIPGIVAFLIQTQTIVLTATAVVRERERGTLEQLLVTPIRPMELMIGKIIPFIFIALFNLLTVLAIGVFWFGVPFQGNLWLFCSLAFLYVFSGLGLGLLLSTISQNQRQASQLVMFFSLLSLVLGGFIFPRYTMPPLIRLIGNIFPLTYFVPISRGIISKGIGINMLTGEVISLAAYILIIMVVAARSFRQRLD